MATDRDLRAQLRRDRRVMEAAAKVLLDLEGAIGQNTSETDRSARMRGRLGEALRQNLGLVSSPPPKAPDPAPGGAALAKKCDWSRVVPGPDQEFCNKPATNGTRCADHACLQCTTDAETWCREDQCPKCELHRHHGGSGCCTWPANVPRPTKPVTGPPTCGATCDEIDDDPALYTCDREPGHPCPHQQHDADGEVVAFWACEQPITAAAELDELALALGLGERPEGQDGVHRASGKEIAERYKEMERRLEKAEDFKAYVHERLDQAGIPTHPDGEHSKEGCRVGDRLDLALAGIFCEVCGLEIEPGVLGAWAHLDSFAAADRGGVHKARPARPKGRTT